MSDNSNRRDAVAEGSVGGTVVMLICVCALGVCLICGCDRTQTAVEVTPPSRSPRDSVIQDNVDQDSGFRSSSGGDVDAPDPSTTDVADGRDRGKPGDSNTPQPATAEQLRETALRALEQGQDDLAFQLVRQVMRMTPDHPQAIFLHALVLGDRHRFHEAIEMLDELAARMPATRLPAMGQTAEWLVLAGNYDQAEARYRTILDEIPDATMVHRHLGQLLLQQGKRIEAASHFRYLAQRGEVNQDELRCLLSLVKPLPKQLESGRLEPLNRLAQSRNQMALQDLDAALEILQPEEHQTSRAGADANRQAVARAEASLRARIQALRNEWDAVRQWAESVQPDAADADGWFAAGCHAAHQQNHDQAIRCFSRTLLIDFTDVDAYDRFSKSLRAVGQTAVADEADRRAKWIRQTQDIGNRLTMNQSRDRALVAKLVTLLQQLKRPVEAFAWQSIDLVFAVNDAAISEAEAENAFLAIGEQRERLLRSGGHQIAPSFILCGLEIDALELRQGD